MVENKDCLVIIHHPQMVGEVVRPPNLDATDSLHVESIEGLFELNAVMPSSRRGTEIIVYEFSKISLVPFEVTSSKAFMRDIADPDHKKKAGDEID
jgi:hypothetical protein